MVLLSFVFSTLLVSLKNDNGRFVVHPITCSEFKAIKTVKDLIFFIGAICFQVTPGKIQLWSPGPNSLCADSALTPVLYGQDTFSGCMLRLSIDDMRNCTFLRELILTNQNRLIQAADIGRRGNAFLNNSADWLPVIR